MFATASRRCHSERRRRRLLERRIPRLLLIAALTLIVLAAVRGKAHAADPATIRIFHADSLKSYISDLSNTFQAAHPNVQIKPEGSGSLDAIRKIKTCISRATF